MHFYSDSYSSRITENWLKDYFIVVETETTITGLVILALFILHLPSFVPHSIMVNLGLSYLNLG